MRERNVNRIEIQDVLSDPDVTTPGKRGKLNLWKTVDGRRLRVTILDTDTEVEVITVVAPEDV